MSKLKIAGVEVSAQYSSMPEASASYDGRVVQYSGDEGEYKTGHFYLCKASGSGYAWGEINPSTITSVNGLDGDVVLTGDNVMSTTGVSLNDAISAKSAVSVSATGSSTDTVGYITVDGVEKKLPTGPTEAYLPLSGGTLTGTLTCSSNGIKLATGDGGGGGLNATNDTGLLAISSGTGYDSGRILLRAKNNSSSPGVVSVIAQDTSSSTTLTINPGSNSSFSRGLDVSGNITGNGFKNNASFLCRTVDTSYLSLRGGSDDQGCKIDLMGDESSQAGQVKIDAQVAGSGKRLLLKSDGTITWGSDHVVTSALTTGTLTSASSYCTLYYKYCVKNGVWAFLAFEPIFSQAITSWTKVATVSIKPTVQFYAPILCDGSGSNGLIRIQTDGSVYVNNVAQSYSYCFSATYPTAF